MFGALLWENSDHSMTSRSKYSWTSKIWTVSKCKLFFINPLEFLIEQKMNIFLKLWLSDCSFISWSKKKFQLFYLKKVKRVGMWGINCKSWNVSVSDQPLTTTSAVTLDVTVSARIGVFKLLLRYTLQLRFIYLCLFWAIPRNKRHLTYA